MEMAADQFQSWIAARLEDLSDLNNPWYDISIFLWPSAAFLRFLILRLGRLRTC